MNLHNYLMLVLFIIITACDQHPKNYEIIDHQLKITIEEFQKNQIPNEDKIIIIDLYSCSPNPVYEIRSVNYTYFLDKSKNFLNSQINSTYVLFKPKFINHIDYYIDSNYINEIINMVYEKELGKSEFEINPHEAYEAWYYFDGKIFNMIDSLEVNNDFGEQYKRLNMKIHDYYNRMPE